MMEEVAADDTNGESTFEFVSDKLAAFDLTTTDADKTQESSIETSKPPLAAPSSISPPAALPSFFSTTSPASVPATVSPPHLATVETSQDTATTIMFTPATPSSKPPLTPYSNTASQRVYQSTPHPSAIPYFSNQTSLSQSINMFSPSGSSYPSTNNSHIFTPSYTQSGSTPDPTHIYELTSSPYMSTPAVQSSAAIDLPLDYSPQYPTQSEIESDNDGSVWGWFRHAVSGSELLNKVAERAKNSVDTMITTLDPQMKEYIHSGGDIDVLVTSDKEVKVNPIREAFQLVFKRATVAGQSAQANIAPQPVGFTAGLKGAEERIQTLRRSGHIDPQQVVVSLENFIVELTPDKWYDIGCLVLEDITYNINLHVYTQATPIPIEFIQQAQDETPPDYPLRWSGLAVTLGQIIERHMPGIHHTEWHSAIVGIMRKQLIHMAAIALATLYKNKLPPRT